MYHFLSGYTAKVAGTERGLSGAPEATFSTCFGAPFMVHAPRAYADLLGDKLRKHRADAWLLNTGWTGGPHGQGQRISLPHTRAMVDAVINHALAEVRYATDPIFGLEYPLACPEVPSELFNPRATWPDAAAYDAQARRLATLFQQNFTRFPAASAAIRAAGPRI
jgi:phosphoenolpyruvate carboxykinase (ATP)